MDLTDEELAFLRWHEIPLDSLFDASGLAGARLKRAMEADGKYFAYNANRCARGHRLKSRAGHCIQCRPASIAFLKRYFAEGYVYVAGSVAGRLLKVGTTQDIGARPDHLNSLRYGGRGDWKIVAYAHTSNSGRVEGEAHGRLAPYAFADDGLRDGRGARSIELFRCNFTDAKDALEQALGGPLMQVDERALERFKFR